MKKNILIISLIAIIIMGVGLALFFLGAKPTLKVGLNNIDSAEIEGQIEYIKTDGDGITFLTYRETALARYSKDGNLKLLSGQVFPATIGDVWYWEDNSKVLIKFLNEEDALSGVEGYKKTDNESVFATYDINRKALLILPVGPETAWVANDKVFGISEGKLFQYTNSTWEKTELSLSNTKPIISAGGLAFGVIDNGKLSVYDTKNSSLTSRVDIGSATYGQTRIFDNGAAIVVDGSETVKIWDAKGKLKKINVPSNEQLLIGKNIFLYSSKKNVFAYMPEKNKTYQLKNMPINLDFYGLFGLSTEGAVYYTGEDYKFSLLNFQDN